MPDQVGVEIYKRFYPFSGAFRLGDPVLASQITGMAWPDFLAALQAAEEAIDDAREMGLEPPAYDQIVLTGLIAVAFWQGNPHMSRDKARRTLERISLEDIEVVSGDEGEEELSPPAEGGQVAAIAESTTSNGSESSQEQYTETTLPGYSSDETSQNASGLHGLPTTSPESLPA